MPRNLRHDPMCRDQSYDVPGFGRCDCDLIARVRADEREQAAERVAALGCGSECLACVAPVSDAVAAARGGDA